MVRKLKKLQPNREYEKMVKLLVVYENQEEEKGEEEDFLVGWDSL